jgi:hypothetical protein
VINCHRSLRLTLRAGILSLLFFCSPAGAQQEMIEPRTVHIFHDNMIHFTSGDSSKYDTALVSGSEQGRVISREIELPVPTRPVRITAHVAARPIAKDEREVHDKWDRAANVRLSRPGMPDIEVIKFITAYGGVTEHEVDVSHLAPLLGGSCTFRGFIDTWSSPGWKLDFSLLFEPVVESDGPDWAEGILYEQSMTEESLRQGSVAVEVKITAGTERVVMNYLASGHCTDGRGADEFVTKDHVITVDGKEVYRFRPWRDDCRQYRAQNPYCRRWSDGSWSSDYSRSGWCPSDKVLPHQIDLSPHLTPGKHVITFNVENVRPKDAEGHFGYWRVSSHLLGWSE